jgi:hypothetical protein
VFGAVIRISRIKLEETQARFSFELTRIQNYDRTMDAALQVSLYRVNA